MSSAICTLFEGDYHCGLGALANSLYARGYRGVIYAGFRGSLPAWASRGSREGENWRFTFAEGASILFISLKTDAHFTNYKPHLMLTLLESFCPDASALFYFDPDITIKCRWSFFEEWIQAGIAACEDINPSMAPNHPIRHAWKTFLMRNGIAVHRDLDAYYNAGFLGVPKVHFGLLERWRQVMELIAPQINGLRNGLGRFQAFDRTFPFCKTDQDAFNMAMMVSEAPMSPVGQDGMDFQPGGGGYIMTHALGSSKPWRRRYVLEALTTRAKPSIADKAFWQHVNHPVRLFGKLSLWWRALDLRTASLLGRVF